MPKPLLRLHVFAEPSLQISNLESTQIIINSSPAV